MSGRDAEWRSRSSRGLARWVKDRLADRGRRSAARAQARAHAPVPPGERILAVARGVPGELVVATDWALYHESGRSWARLGWEQVAGVRWDEQRRVLVLTGLTPAAPARTVLPLAREWGLPAVVTERVTWTCVLDQRLSLNGRGGVRVLARRVPGQASLRWVVIADNGVDPADPAVRAELESALRGLRAVTGV